VLTFPQWFDTKKAYLDGLETQLKGLVKAMETVAKQRVELSLTLSEFGETIEALSGTDISSQLASTLQNLAAVQSKAKKLQDDQAQQDAVTFAGTGEGFHPRPVLGILITDISVEEYGRMIQSVRVRATSFLHTLRLTHVSGSLRLAYQMLRPMAKCRKRCPARKISGRKGAAAGAQPCAGRRRGRAQGHARAARIRKSHAAIEGRDASVRYGAC
jgi:sorting nexin-1/2